MSNKWQQTESRLRLIRYRLEGILDAVKDSEDPPFTSSQVWFLEDRFEAVDGLFPDGKQEVTISQRVERCRTALTGYSGDDRFICLIDLIADAMHWCAANGEDFHYALAFAGKHYVNELNGEQADERRKP